MRNKLRLRRQDTRSGGAMGDNGGIAVGAKGSSSVNKIHLVFHS